jgi:formate-dependent nitrite reductase membrane component NrfD
MDTDLYLVIGIVVCALSIPSLLSAYVEGRPPRIGGIFVLVGGILVIVALTNHGRGYTFSEIPDVFFKVIGRYLN